MDITCVRDPNACILNCNNWSSFKQSETGRICFRLVHQLMKSKNTVNFKKVLEYAEKLES